MHERRWRHTKLEIQYKFKQTLEWTDSHQKAFDQLVNACCSPPVLGFADYTLPFTLHTDASAHGLGAVLYQEQEGKQRVIAYVNRSLKLKGIVDRQLYNKNNTL